MKITKSTTLAATLFCVAVSGASPRAHAAPATKAHPQLKAPAKRMFQAERGALKADAPKLSARQKLVGSSSQTKLADGSTVKTAVTFKNSTFWSRFAVFLKISRPAPKTELPWSEPSLTHTREVIGPGGKVSTESLEQSQAGSITVRTTVKGGIEDKRALEIREHRDNGYPMSVYQEKVARSPAKDARATSVFRTATRYHGSSDVSLKSTLFQELGSHRAFLRYERNEGASGGQAAHSFDLNFGSGPWKIYGALSVQLDKAGAVSIDSAGYHDTNLSFAQIPAADKARMVSELETMIGKSKSIAPVDKARLIQAVRQGTEKSVTVY